MYRNNIVMKRFLLAYILFFAIAANTYAASKSAYIWHKLEDGIYHTRYSFSPYGEGSTTITAFRINPQKYYLRVLLAHNTAYGDSAKEMQKRNHALLVINGGFFTLEHKSIGLIMNNGRVINSLHKTSWWSIFKISHKKPMIIMPTHFKSSKDIKMAIQAGPRLVINGRMPKLKGGIAARSAIGITKDGMIIIAITKGQGITLDEMANRMAENKFKGGLNCSNAMALDGGGSSQIYAKIGSFSYDQSGLKKVSNGIGVFKK